MTTSGFEAAPTITKGVCFIPFSSFKFQQYLPSYNLLQLDTILPSETMQDRSSPLLHENVSTVMKAIRPPFRPVFRLHASSLALVSHGVQTDYPD